MKFSKINKYIFYQLNLKQKNNNNDSNQIKLNEVVVAIEEILM